MRGRQERGHQERNEHPRESGTAFRGGDKGHKGHAGQQVDGYQGQKQNDFLETDAKHELLLLCVQPLELSGKRVPRIGRPARVERGDHA